jgi:microcin C transport system substrate-binding protein
MLIMRKLVTCLILAVYLLSGHCLASKAENISRSHAIAMHGLPKYPQDFKHFDYADPSASKGGRLKLGVQGNFDSLNPFIAKGTAGDKVGWIYDSLTVQSGDEAFSRYGLLAESIELPENRSWVIYHLRENAYFHDGHPITAEDVVFSFNILKDKGSPIYQSYYAQVSEVTALSDYSVKFSFNGEVNRELALIVGEFAVMPKHFWQDRDFSKSSLDIPLGSGPYKIVEANPGRSLVYQRVNNYWAKDLPVNVGKYNFDTIQLDYYKDAVVLLEALKSGQYDVRVENYSKQWATGYTGTAINKGWLKRENIAHENPTGMQCFLMNLRNPLFEDIRVRKALTYAFDFEWTNKNLFYDAYSRTNSFFSNSELASSGPLQGREKAILLPYKEQLPSSIFTRSFTLPVSDADGYNRKNLRQSVKWLREAGWHVENNQLINNATGQPFSFEIMLVQPSFERIVNPFAKALKKLGINVTIRHVEVSQYINRMRSFDFDMVVGSMGQSLSPGNEQIEYWHSSRANTQGSRNMMGLKNPVVDELVSAIVAAPDREELIHLTRALDRVLLNNYYVIPQWHIGSHRLAYWDKFSKPAISPKYDPDFSLGLLTWWFDPDKAQRIKQGN